MAHLAMNLRVEIDVMGGPLSDTASRIGSRSSSVSGSTGWSARASTSGRRPSAARASLKTISTWLEVSSALTMSAIHMRLTRSSTMVTAMAHRVKWVVS
jgi:hypothetical protein